MKKNIQEKGTGSTGCELRLFNTYQWMTSNDNTYTKTMRLRKENLNER
jgi:hypothetical protein